MNMRGWRRRSSFKHFKCKKHCHKSNGERIKQSINGFMTMLLKCFHWQNKQFTANIFTMITFISASRVLPTWHFPSDFESCCSLLILFGYSTSLENCWHRSLFSAISGIPSMASLRALEGTSIDPKFDSVFFRKDEWRAIYPWDLAQSCPQYRLEYGWERQTRWILYIFYFYHAFLREI